MVIQEKDLFENFEIVVEFEKFKVVEVVEETRKMELSANNISEAINYIMRRLLARKENVVSLKDYFQFIKSFQTLIQDYSK